MTSIASQVLRSVGRYYCYILQGLFEVRLICRLACVKRTDTLIVPG